MPFKFERFEISELVLIEPRVFHDERGFFMETYKYSEFAAFGIQERFVQDNHSRSVKGVLRGLHYQNPPKAQGKLVRAIVGEIYNIGGECEKKNIEVVEMICDILKNNPKTQHLRPEIKFIKDPRGVAHDFRYALDCRKIKEELGWELQIEFEEGLERTIEWYLENQ
ncbi:MAG TPA: dTDP-4-dehydrorhamnose 3,5-epimerase, partial [Caldilineae bacterium]|nr:dTDP-4-dehydrorhamnose 3,5-epimerase [Caldilineae bacterium]